MQSRTFLRAGLGLVLGLGALAGLLLVTGGPTAWRVVGARGASGPSASSAPASSAAAPARDESPVWRPAPLAFRAVSLATRPGARPASGAPAFADVDGDGVPDLFVAGGEGAASELHLAREGRLALAEPGLLGLADAARYRAGAFADFDDDGDRDLYLAGIGATPDELMRQLPGGRFERATEEYGLSSPITGRTRAALWTDLDGDGRLDLYLLRDGGPDGFARRQAGATFVEVAAEAGLRGGLDALSVLVADLDGDRDPDVLASRGDSVLGDRVLLGRGDGVFVERAALPGLDAPLRSTATAQGDVDGDGLLDLLVASAEGGARLLLAREDEHGARSYAPAGEAGVPELDLGGRRLAAARLCDLDLDGALELLAIGPQGLELHRGRGDGRFADVTAESGLRGLGAGGGRAFALGDVDLDGDLDVAVSGGGDGVLLLENQARGAAWLRVRAPGRAGNAEGIGALVRAVLPDGRHLVRTIDPGRDDPALCIGLGAATSVLDLRVEWSDGGRARLQGVPAGVLVALHQSASAPLVASHPAALVGAAPSFPLETALERVAGDRGAKLPPVEVETAEARARQLEAWLAREGGALEGATRDAALARIASETRLELAARALVQRLRLDEALVDARAAERRPDHDRPARVAGSAYWFPDAAAADRARAEGNAAALAELGGEPHAFVLDAPTWARLAREEGAPFSGLALPEPGALSRVFVRGAGYGLLRVEQILPPEPLPPRVARELASADLLRVLAAREVDRLLGVEPPLGRGAARVEQP